MGYDMVRSPFIDRRRSTATIAIAAVGLLFGCAPAAPGSSTETVAADTGDGAEIVIGVLAPVTGFMSPHGTAIRDGAQLAVDTLNDGGGIDGRPVRMVVADGASDPATNTERARQLIGRDGASFLVGTGSSAETLAVIPVATETRTPFIYSIDGELKTCHPDDPEAVNPYVFAAGPTPEMLLGSFLPRLIDAHGDRVYFVGSDYVFPRSLNGVARTFVESVEGTVLADSYVPTGTTDFASEIRSIGQQEPDVLFLTLPGADGVTFVRQARQFGLFDDMVVTGSATFDTENYTGFGAEAHGVRVVNRYSELLENPENTDFVTAFRDRFPGYDGPLGPTAAAGGYGAVMALAAGIEAAGTDDADAVVEALAGLDVDLPQGRVHIDPTNHVFNQPLYEMRIEDSNYRVVADLGMSEHPGFTGCSVG